MFSTALLDFSPDITDDVIICVQIVLLSPTLLIINNLLWKTAANTV